MIKVFLAILLTTSIYSDVYIEGSSTIKPILILASKAFKTKTGIDVHVKGGGSGHGVKVAMSKKIDFGAAARKLHPQEKILDKHTIGYDGIAVIINEKNNLNNFTNTQINNIFSGEYDNYKQLGSKKNLQITLVAKEKGRATREQFNKHFKIKNISKKANIIGPNIAAIVLVASEPSAIGYVSVGTAIHAKENNTSIKLVQINNIIPNKINIEDGTYPLTRELNLVSYGKLNYEAMEFLKYLKSDDGQRIVKDLGFVGIK